MNNYILDRLRADAKRVIELSDNESKLQHFGLQGRFRELLINDLFIPWLPPYVSCGTGMIIACENVIRSHTQEDIIIYDKTLTPPILASNNASEGVFLINSVLIKVEVKSTLNNHLLHNFVKSSDEISKMMFSTHTNLNKNLDSPYNLLVAYGSDAKGNSSKDFELLRLINVMTENNIDPFSGIVSMLCVLGKGFWKLGIDNFGNKIWQSLTFSEPYDQLVWLVACVSNSCYQIHALRQGRDPSSGLETGIGTYLEHPFIPVIL